MKAVSVLLCFACALTLTSGGEADETCTAYRLLTKFAEECQFKRFQSPSLAHLTLQETGTLSGKDVLKFIERDCGFRKSDYRTCAESLTKNCSSDDQNRMLNLVRESQDTFCDGTKVNFWIEDFVNEGFSMDWACIPRIQEVSKECYRDNVPQDFEPDTSSLTLTYFLYEWQLQKVIPCTFEKLQLADTVPGCTSSWIDQAFYLWLFRENRQPLSHMSQSQRRLFLRRKTNKFIDLLQIQNGSWGKK